MADKLLPCPFCGGEVELVKQKSDEFEFVLVSCKNCDATIGIGGSDNEQKVTEAWNNRPSLWHTGTPTYRGRYLVSNGYDTSISYFDGKEFIKDFLGFPDVGDIVKWQKIEPFKEDK